ncbi:MAG: DNA/RNA non-specific endonuclease [Sphingomonas fennica]
MPGTWRGGGFTGGGGGSFGGAGASGTWGLPEDGPPRGSPRPSASTRPISRHDGPTILAPARPARTPAPTDTEYQTVERNGYRYEIDDRDRTRRVTGALTVARAPVRSRTAQARAGGAERRATDDGGHYIAARFNGPTEAFNHYAQDATVNRGRYRALEDQWARDKRAGRSVSVRIVPVFDGSAVRPSHINVWWTVDGNPHSDKIPNQPKGQTHGQRGSRSTFG